METKRKVHTCIVCSKVFTPRLSPSDYKKCTSPGTTCSRACLSIKQKGAVVEKKCGFCEIGFYVPVYLSQQRYCSATCGNHSRRGKRPWNFGVGQGRTLDHNIRVHKKYRYWRESVLLKNNGVCVCCGEIATHAHHIYMLQAILNKYSITSIDVAVLCDAVWDVSNGVPMCQRCHHSYHKIIPSSTDIQRSGAGHLSMAQMIKRSLDSYIYLWKTQHKV